MIKVRSFFNDTAMKLASDIEDYIKFFKINREQIISINFAVDDTSKFALLTYEE